MLLCEWSMAPSVALDAWHDLVRCQTRAPPLLRSDNQRSYRGQKRDHNVHCLEHLKGEEPTHFRAHLRRWCSDTAGNTIGGFQFGSSPVVGWWFLFYHVKCSLSSSSRVFEFWILFVLCNITIVLNLLLLKWYSSSPAFPSKKKKAHKACWHGIYRRCNINWATKHTSEASVACSPALAR